VSTQTAYVIMLNDDSMFVVLGSKERAQTRLEELRENYWLLHQGTLQNRRDYNLRHRWYIREVDAEVAA
jgi:predicted ATPase